MATLYCDRFGDRRYSALYAKVRAFGVERTIEQHYQLAKRKTGMAPPVVWTDMKGKKPDSLVINGQTFTVARLSAWYALLWLWYLDDHPELVQHAQQFDEFVDRMAGKAINRQDRMVEAYAKHGRERLLLSCRGLLADLGLSDAPGTPRGEPAAAAAAE